MRSSDLRIRREDSVCLPNSGNRVTGMTKAPLRVRRARGPRHDSGLDAFKTPRVGPP